jgi:hypothetical protein
MKTRLNTLLTIALLALLAARLSIGTTEAAKNPPTLTDADKQLLTDRTRDAITLRKQIVLGRNTKSRGSLMSQLAQTFSARPDSALPPGQVKKDLTDDQRAKRAETLKAKGIDPAVYDAYQVKGHAPDDLRSMSALQRMQITLQDGVTELEDSGTTVQDWGMDAFAVRSMTVEGTRVVVVADTEEWTTYATRQPDGTDRSETPHARVMHRFTFQVEGKEWKIVDWGMELAPDL